MTIVVYCIVFTNAYQTIYCKLFGKVTIFRDWLATMPNFSSEIILLLAITVLYGKSMKRVWHYYVTTVVRLYTTNWLHWSDKG